MRISDSLTLFPSECNNILSKKVFEHFWKEVDQNFFFKAKRLKIKLQFDHHAEGTTGQTADGCDMTYLYARNSF